MKNSFICRMGLIVFFISGPNLSWGFDLNGILGSNKSEPPIINKIQSSAFDANSPTKDSSLDLDYLQTEGFGLMPEFSLQKYANGILNKLLKSVEVSGFQGQVNFRVANEYGAFTTAGGNIAINLGTLRDLESEDEIAAVIAHELSHALLHHHNSDTYLELQRTMQTAAEWGVAFKAVAENMGKIGAATVSRESTEMLQQLQLVVLLSENVISPAWNRTQETEADRLGFDLLIKAGYDGNAMLSVLEKERQYGDVVKNRRAKTEQQIAKGGDMGKVFQAGFGSILTALASNHPDAKLRQQELSLYMLQNYPEYEGAEQNVKAWNAARTEREASKILQNYEYALKGHRLLESNDVHGFEYAQKAISVPTVNHPYPVYVASLAFEKRGRIGNATNLLESAIRKSKSNALLYSYAASLYEKSGNSAMALKMVNSGYKESRSAPRFLPAIIRLNKKTGNSNLAFEKNIECSLKYPNLKDECQRAAALN